MLPLLPPARSRSRFFSARALTPILASAALLCAAPALAQFSSTGSIVPPLPAGQPSPWTIAGNLAVGNAAAGTLTIGAGGSVSNTQGRVGMGGNGAVTVSGANATWTNSNELYVGADSPGTLKIQNGGSVSSGMGHVGYPSDGQVTVDGANSTWSIPGAFLYVGDTGQGTLNVTGGGSVSGPTYDIHIGNAAAGVGAVTVSGAGSALQASTVYVGYSGQGALTIADAGAVTAAGPVTLGFYFGGTGALNIGAPAAEPAAAPGSLNALYLNTGDGAGALVFNHTDTSGNYAFSQPISGNLTLDVWAGVTALTRGSAYGGATTVHAGTLAADGADALSPYSDFSVEHNGILALKSGDDQTVASLNNSGRVTLQANPATGTTLTVTGDYSGDGGMIALDATLDDSASATDKLVVGGSTQAGTTTLWIMNRGGLGAQTTGDGILLVQVAGASNATFALPAPIVVGGFQYTLAKAADGNWYLQSAPVPAAPAAAAAVPTLTETALVLLALLLAGGAMARRRG